MQVPKIATQSPDEVVIIALDIPADKDFTSAPVLCKALNVSIIPTTVPKSPSNGTTPIIMLVKFLVKRLLKKNSPTKNALERII